MPRASKNPAPEPCPSAFVEQLTEALKHFNDPAWLGEHSPLAAPYFMGEHLAAQPAAVTATGRGRALRTLLQATIETLPPDAADLLKRSYFESISPQRIALELHISRATCYRYLSQALAQLADALAQRLRPALRLAVPAAPQTLVGRADVAARCLAALRQNQTVALIGPAGIGKTSLGAHLANRAQADGWTQAVFWYTFQPGLNDRLSSLLFALGHCLHRQGASGLWLQLAADQEQIKPHVALGLLGQDLSRTRLLLCFDELDLLRPAEIQAHAQLVTFLASLRGLAPLLLMGQQPLVEADAQHTLDGLTGPAIEEMFKQAGLELDGLEQLQTATQGNPRLLELALALHRSGEPLSDVLEYLWQNPSTEFLLDRVWRRLDADEQALLAALSVLRRPAPADAWSAQETLAKLIERRLVLTDGRGGVEIAPAFKSIIYHTLSPENREALHRQAAVMRAQRGEYTEAAFHYVQGRQFQTAIQLWYEHSEQEINQGQTEAAWAILSEISPRQVRGETREKLALLVGQLGKLLGKYDQALHILRETLWQNPFRQGRAKRLEGDIWDLLGDYDRSLRAYEDGLQAIEPLAQSEAALFHKNLGWAAMRQRDFDRARREAQLARYEAVKLQGLIEEEQGNYAQAQHYYAEALALAQSARSEAQMHNHLGVLLTRLGQFEPARQHLEQARRQFERVGDLANRASVQVNLAFMHNLAGQPQAAIPPAQAALEFFEQTRQSGEVAIAAQNLAEAYLALGDLNNAEKFARRVIGEEDASTLPDGWRVLGEIKLAQGEFQLARECIQQSVEIARRNQDRFLEAYAWRALGQVCVAMGQDQPAQEASSKAIELFEALGLPQEVEKTIAVIKID